LKARIIFSKSSTDANLTKSIGEQNTVAAYDDLQETAVKEDVVHLLAWPLLVGES